MKLTSQSKKLKTKHKPMRIGNLIPNLMRQYLQDKDKIVEQRCGYSKRKRLEKLKK